MTPQEEAAIRERCEVGKTFTWITGEPFARISCEEALQIFDALDAAKSEIRKAKHNAKEGGYSNAGDLPGIVYQHVVLLKHREATLDAARRRLEEVKLTLYRFHLDCCTDMEGADLEDFQEAEAAGATTLLIAERFGWKFSDLAAAYYEHKESEA